MQVIADQPPPILLRSVGIDPPLSCIIFVEDEMAKRFCGALLERFDSSFARRASIERRNGEGEIKKALEITKSLSQRVKFLGLFDGDMRNSIPDDLQSVSACLPGSTSIEEIFREMVTTDPEPLSQASGNNQLSTILANLEGKDCHDWYEEMGKELGLTKDQLFHLLFRIWIQNDDNKRAAEETYDALVKLVSAE